MDTDDQRADILKATSHAYAYSGPFSYYPFILPKHLHETMSAKIAEDASPTEAQASAALTKVKTLQKPPPTSYLQALQRRLPCPSRQRQQESLHETPFDLSMDEPKPKTILYLAYGSNLCAETFLGKRGIRPISQTNVAVPALVMTFDLAGLPYTEPCFANTAYRDTQTPSTASEQKSESSPLLTQGKKPKYHKKRWLKPLVGVVYEVTPADFAHIIATEGGGASYHDILVDCHPLPAGSETVPMDPDTPTFKAHTLFSPATDPGSPPPKDGGSLRRPDPAYAQPSARYLKLIRDGAHEHSFPSEYVDYLNALRPYTMTSQKQALGRFIFMMMWWPILMALFTLGPVFRDKKGRSPPWLRTLVAAVFKGVWASYDGMFKGMFGDGERTQGDEEDMKEDPKEEEEGKNAVVKRSGSEKSIPGKRSSSHLV